jgi:hypothetical protein
MEKSIKILIIQRFCSLTVQKRGFNPPARSSEMSGLRRDFRRNTIKQIPDRLERMSHIGPTIFTNPFLSETLFPNARIEHHVVILPTPHGLSPLRPIL